MRLVPVQNLRGQSTVSYFNFRLSLEFDLSAWLSRTRQGNMVTHPPYSSLRPRPMMTPNYDPLVRPKRRTVRVEEVRSVMIEMNVNTYYPLCSDNAYTYCKPSLRCPWELLGTAITLAVPTYSVQPWRFEACSRIITQPRFIPPEIYPPIAKATCCTPKCGHLPNLVNPPRESICNSPRLVNEHHMLLPHII